MLRQRFKQDTARGLEVELLENRNSLLALEPRLSPNVIAASHVPQSGHCTLQVEHADIFCTNLDREYLLLWCDSKGDPKQTTHALADAAESLGVKIIEGESVESVFINTTEHTAASPSSRYSVRTSTGRSITADSIVVACGAWASFMEGGGAISQPSSRRVNVHIPVYPVKGTIWCTESVHKGYLQKVIFVAESALKWQHWHSRDEGSNRQQEQTLLPIPEHCTHDRNRRRRVRHAYVTPRITCCCVWPV